MASPKFFGVDLSSPTYTWSAGFNASYPVSNLKTYFPDQKSRSNAVTAGQNFKIDFGVAVACNTLIIQGHNFAAVIADTVSLEADDNAGFASPELIIAAITVASATEIVLQTFASKSYRYWRLVYDCAGPLAAAPEIGNIFLGTTLDFETTQQWGFYTNVPQSPKVSRLRSLDNRLRTALVGNDIRRHKISFDQNNSQTDALITSYLAFLATTHNGAVPFYYIDNNSAVYLVNFEKDYNPYDAFRYNKNKIPDLSMESTIADA